MDGSLAFHSDQRCFPRLLDKSFDWVMIRKMMTRVNIRIIVMIKMRWRIKERTSGAVFTGWVRGNFFETFSENLLVLAFSNDLFAENSKFSVVSGSERNQFLECM